MQEIKTAEQFNELIAGVEPILVKFVADWCPDCKRMDMFIDPIVEKYDTYTWYEADRDVIPEIAEQYEVMGIPSLLIFKNNEKKAHLHSANAKSPQEVTDFLDNVSL